MTIDYVLTEQGVHVPRAAAHVELRERIAELEFALEDQGWLRLDGTYNTEFSRQGLHTITHLARLMYLKNPLILRGVNVKADYVFGRSIEISAKDDAINTVVQAFIDDPHNQMAFTSHASRIQKEKELQTDGNIFFVLFVHAYTGGIRVSSIPVDEITDIITNPDNRKEPWYYLRTWQQRSINLETGLEEIAQRSMYYPDWRYKPSGGMRTTIGVHTVALETICHLKVGGFSDWRFGVSEVYAAIDWAKAYKKFLEDWATITAAYAKYAFKVTTPGGARGVRAATQRLSTTYASGGSRETNPPPPAGSTFVKDPSVDIDPIKTAGATTKAEDGRRMLLMVAASFGVPETFFGDVSVGTLATAKSLDRPTELAFLNRQAFWIDTYHMLFAYVIYHAVRAPNGPLRSIGEVGTNEYGEEIVTYGDGIDTGLDIDFPPIVEKDVQQYIASLVSGATLDGKTPSIITDRRLLARMILIALGENEIDELLDTMYPDGVTIDEPAPTVDPTVTAAVESLKEAIEILTIKL